MPVSISSKSGVNVLPIGYEEILTIISSKIHDSQVQAIKAVNHHITSLYREIGKTIHVQQESGKWGDSVVERLALDLQNKFPGTKGFSSRNLWRMKDFYLACHGSEILTTLSSEISWSHNVALILKCKDRLEREFYMRMAKRNSWSYRVLLHHIELGTYEKTIHSQNNFTKNLPTNLNPEAQLTLKDGIHFIS